MQRDPFCLDRVDLQALKQRPRVIVSDESYIPLLEQVQIHHIAPPPRTGLYRVAARIPLLNALCDQLIALHVAVRLLLAMRRPGAVGLVSLGSHSGSLFCFLNSFRLFRGGPVIAYRALLPARAGRLNTYRIGRSLRSAALVAVWSRAQIENYHRAFNIPRDKFVFFPYKANHSKASSNPLSVGDYVFSGGNSERDYKTLFQAVEGLSIPVLVSVTKPGILRGLSVPANVIVVNASEPAFERLMAGSRIVAVCLKQDIIRGSGEATILNAMWHGRPVVVADNVSASDYIEDGVDGFVVPGGDADQLRRRILELWKDPAFAARVGEAGQRKVANLYTHNHFKTRMQTLAMLVFDRAQQTPQ